MTPFQYLVFYAGLESHTGYGNQYIGKTVSEKPSMAIMLVRCFGIHRLAVKAIEDDTSDEQKGLIIKARNWTMSQQAICEQCGAQDAMTKGSDVKGHQHQDGTFVAPFQSWEAMANAEMTGPANILNVSLFCETPHWIPISVGNGHTKSGYRCMWLAVVMVGLSSEDRRVLFKNTLWPKGWTNEVAETSLGKRFTFK